MTTRRLAAILAADVVGFSSMMEKDEEGTAARIRALRREVIEPTLAEHQGRLVKTTGDGFLAEFASPVQAVRSAISMQEAVAAGSNGLRLRIGVNLGDIIVEDDGDVLGEGVNVAARLEEMADAGGVLVSGKIYEEVEGKIDRGFESRGEQQVKNLARRVRVYALARVTPSKAEPRALTLPDKPSIAVLPFTNMSSDPEQSFFGDGIAEDIITTLSNISSLLVIARNSTFAYKGRASDVRQIGRELGVRYILEGSVRRASERIRVTAQLIDASDGSHVWAERYDRPLADVFDIQDELTREIVTALRVALTDGEQARVWQRSTKHVSAWADAMRGLDHIWRGNATDNEVARRFFTSAVRRDPQYSRAHAMLAHTYYFDIRFGYTTQVEAAQQCLAEHALRALSLNPQEPYAFTVHANGLWLSGQFDEGVNAARRATEISPNDAFCWLILGRACVGAERLEEGERAVRAAMRLNPLYPVSYPAVLADAFLRQGRFEAALDVLAKIVCRNSNYMSAHLLLAGVHGEKGDLEKARQAVAEVLRINPAYRLSMARRFYLSSDHGRQERFVSILQAAGLPE